MADKFITVTAVSQQTGSNPPPEEITMMVNLRQIQWFSFPPGDGTKMKLRHYDREFSVKENELSILHKFHALR